MTSEQQYLDSLQNVLDNGTYKQDRTGTGTYSVFGTQNRYNLREGFPLLTTKKIHLKSVIHELLWFLKGETNTNYLTENGVRIWDEWAAKEDQIEKETLSPFGRVEEAVHSGLWTGSKKELNDILNSFKTFKDDHEFLDSLGVSRTKDIIISKKGDLGPVYGKQWRDWVSPSGEHIDQISRVIDQLRNDPDSRRIIVSAWNVGELDNMALMPCHAFFQFYTRELDDEEKFDWAMDNVPKEKYDEIIEMISKQNLTYGEWEGERFNYLIDLAPERELSCQLYQRSMDKFLGEPFNIASYALLTHMIAQQVGMAVGDFIHTAGDAHIYSNHIEQVKLQLSREPRELPTLVIKRKPDSIFDYKFEDFEFEGYDPHPVIKGKVAI